MHGLPWCLMYGLLYYHGIPSITSVNAWFAMVFDVRFTILPRYTFNYLGKCMVHLPGVKQAAQYTPVYHIGYHGMLCSSIGYTVAKVGLPSLVYCSMYDLPHYHSKYKVHKKCKHIA